MELNDIQAAYFIGAGGIGMSAVARYFLGRGAVVAGYDRTPSLLTAQLEKEGMLIHFDDNIDEIPFACKDPDHCVVVYTPAVPESHKELSWFRDNGFCVEKRAQTLGRLTQHHKALCVAGTHGKTTTSTICANIMHESRYGCNAFLGGIAKNFDSNFLFSKESPYVVIEADEYDRSFHWLRPFISVITSTDADHLDIYGTKAAYLDSFRHYTTLIRPGGALIIRRGIDLRPAVQGGVRIFDYGREAGDFHAENIEISENGIRFDFISPLENVPHIELEQPIAINIDNSVAAMAMAQLSGCSADELRYGVRSYRGVARRFDIKVKNDRHVLISDYAHHPKEIVQSAKSIRQMFPGRKITVAFQPHLYSRTRDFSREFAAALSLFDEVLLCEIYPAREEPIKGVTSGLIFDKIAPEVEKTMVQSADIQAIAEGRDFDVLVVLGAGDLDKYVPRLAQIIEKKG
ncbi:MAG: UDP-N-acetylmuramate--L-alanine ligase [Prevotella sp.]|nr:UDP-N-acetylmuramate--L-alanine ligase [Prevotella sp.]